MERPLGVMERALARTAAFAPLTVVIVVRLQGAPSAETLRPALDRLQRRHPLLRAHLSDHRRFVVGAPQIPLQVLIRRDHDHWREVAAAELNHRLDSERGPLLRCSYLRADGTGHTELCLALHHTLVDSVASSTLLDELLRELAGLGNDPKEAAALPAADALLPPGRATLPQRLRYIARELRGGLGAALASGGQGTSVATGNRSGLLSDQLDAEATAALAVAARRHRVGLASTVHAAMMLALRRRQSGVSAMTGVYFADLRPYLSPPVPAGALGCYIALLRFRVVVPRSDHGAEALWTLAEKIQSTTLQAGRRGDKFAAAATIDLFMRLALATRAQRLGDTALSFTGAIPLEERYGDVVVDDVHGFISNNALGPIFTAQGRLFGGRLRLDAVYLHADLTPDRATELLDDTLTQLRGAAP